MILPFPALKAIEGFSDDAIRLSRSRRFFKIADSAVPQDPDWQKRENYLRQTFLGSVNDLYRARVNMASAEKAMRENRTVFLLDIDGTESEFVFNPLDAALVPGLVDTLERLGHHADGSRAFNVTGRCESEAPALYLKERPNLVIPAICSHGTVMLKPEGSGLSRYALELSEDQSAFMRAAHALADEIGAWSDLKSPLEIVQKKYSSIDIKARNEEDIQRIEKRLRAFCEGDINPRVEGQPCFAVHKEGSLEISIRFERADKKAAIDHFVIPETGRDCLFVYAGDSFGIGGTDRAAARYVQEVLGGIAIQVLNDRPQEMDGFVPHVILPNPEALGTILRSVADYKDAMIPGNPSKLSLKRA